MLNRIKINAPVSLLRKYVNLKDEAAKLLSTGNVNEYVHVLVKMQKIRSQICPNNAFLAAN